MNWRWILPFIFGGVVLEVTSRLALLLLNYFGPIEIRTLNDIFSEQSSRIEELLSRSGEGQVEIDPSLGWRYRANFKQGGDIINSQRLRSLREYSQVPNAGVQRIAVFGDSFVYGTEVDTVDSWPSQLETLKPDFEVLNYGVGGYGTDQAYMRFRAEGFDFSPQVVVMGFQPVMLRRNTNVYRRFISDREWPLLKPRFRWNATSEHSLEMVPLPPNLQEYYRELILHPRKVNELGQDDLSYSPMIYGNPLYDVFGSVRLASYFGSQVYQKYLSSERLIEDGLYRQESEAYKVTIQILKEFVSEVRRKNLHTMIVIFPSLDLLERADMNGKILYQPLLDDCKDFKLPCFDLLPEFRKQKSLAGGYAPFFMQGGHYSAHGNGVVASFLKSALANQVE
ncbi:MAG: hypothetical protein KDD60_02985 [Bdellovibrionales bacterium]|nr:hypothetical protein [Bdellovibrionales bacterium]